jgi:hypothetical protein
VIRPSNPSVITDLRLVVKGDSHCDKYLNKITLQNNCAAVFTKIEFIKHCASANAKPNLHIIAQVLAQIEANSSLSLLFSFSIKIKSYAGRILN